MEFGCVRAECPYDGPRPYVLKVPPEACVDEHNCATFFCPHCAGELVKIDTDDTDTKLAH